MRPVGGFEDGELVGGEGEGLFKGAFLGDKTSGGGMTSSAKKKW